MVVIDSVVVPVSFEGLGTGLSPVTLTLTCVAVVTGICLDPPGCVSAAVEHGAAV